MMSPRDVLVLIKGAGDLASGVAARLQRCGFPVVMTELAEPLMVRRTVAFGEAVYAAEAIVEGIVARRADGLPDVRAALECGAIPVLVDPLASCRSELKPFVLVDAIMAKRNTGTTGADAPLVIGLGPGFTAGIDCHAVIETNRGHAMGRVLWQGQAEPNTAMPGEVAGRCAERVLRAPGTGMLRSYVAIGDQVTSGQIVASVDGQVVPAGLDGVLRGMLHTGLWVVAGTKLGDVDPRAEPMHCFTFSDKSLAIGGGVLEAILTWLAARTPQHPTANTPREP
jgi:xanthine dehydrogenase accessory factor